MVGNEKKIFFFFFVLYCFKLYFCKVVITLKAKK